VSRNDVILGVAALVLVVFALVVSLVIPRRDPGFPGRNLKAFVAVAALLVVAMLTSVEVFGAKEKEAGGKAEAAATETSPAEGGQTGGAETGGAETGGTAVQGDPAAGKDVFASAGCGSCHTLEEAGTTGTTGPNLDQSTLSFDAEVDQVTNGGAVMPAFGDKLSEKQIRDVAAFVVASHG
jgi:mono/diheme cytochrome c family protein